MQKILGFNSQNPKQKQKQEKVKTTETKQISVTQGATKEEDEFPDVFTSDVQKDTK